jgi:hypothetical protein
VWSLPWTAAAEQAGEHVRTHALKGPFPTLTRYCAAEARQGEQCQLHEGWNGGTSERVPGSDAIIDSRIFVTEGSVAGSPFARCQLALQTTRGWFVDETVSACSRGDDESKAFAWKFKDGTLTIAASAEESECQIGLRAAIGRHRIFF